jgi:hypothetical protein
LSRPPASHRFTRCSLCGQIGGRFRASLPDAIPFSRAEKPPDSLKATRRAHRACHPPPPRLAINEAGSRGWRLPRPQGLVVLYVHTGNGKTHRPATWPACRAPAWLGACLTHPVGVRLKAVTAQRHTSQVANAGAGDCRVRQACRCQVTEDREGIGKKTAIVRRWRRLLTRDHRPWRHCPCRLRTGKASDRSRTTRWVNKAQI